MKNGAHDYSHDVCFLMNDECARIHSTELHAKLFWSMFAIFLHVSAPVYKNTPVRHQVPLSLISYPMMIGFFGRILMTITDCRRIFS